MPKLNIHDPKVIAGGAGVVGVVGFALYKAHQNGVAAGGSSTTSDPTGAADALGDASSQDAVYGSLEDQLQGLAGIVAQLQNTPPPTPSSPAPTSPIPKAPASKSKPVPQANASYKLPPLPKGTLAIPGERVVSSVVDDAGNGGYYLTNYGGVYAVGLAPFLGAAPGITAGKLPTNLFTKIVATKNGYDLINSVGQSVDITGKGTTVVQAATAKPAPAPAAKKTTLAQKVSAAYLPKKK